MVHICPLLLIVEHPILVDKFHNEVFLAEEITSRLNISDVYLLYIYTEILNRLLRNNNDIPFFHFV
jgi:hypothetical protein